MIGAWMVSMLPAVLAGWIVKAAVLLGLAWGATTLLGRGSAALRHGIWAMAVLGALLLPLGSLVMPRLEVTLLPPPVGRAHPTVAPVAPEPVLRARQVAVAAGSVAPAAVARSQTARKAGTAVVMEAPMEPEFATMQAPFAVASDATASVAAEAASLFLPIWLLVSLGLIARLLLAQRRARRMEWELEDAAGTRIDLFVQRIARERGVSRLRVLIGPADAMPATWGAGRPVLVLPSGSVHWSPSRLEAVARHELAHVARRDVPVQMAADLLCALHWFNPLVWLAAYRLRVERELACDDEVLAAGARPSDYAAELVVLARSLRDAHLPAAAVAMTRTGKLRGRVEAVLDPARARGEPDGLRRALRTAVAAVFVLLAMVSPTTSWAETKAPLPAKRDLTRALTEVRQVVPPRTASAIAIALPARVQAGTMCWNTRTDGSRTSRRNDDLTEIEWFTDDCRVRIRIEGEVTFNDDFTAITGVSRLATFEERDGDRQRRVELRPRGGSLEHRWLVDGQERPYDAEAEEWLSAMLLNAFRSGGLAAEQRVEWMLRERGVDAVLAEIPLLHGDWVRGMYYRAALSDPSLDNARIAQLLGDVGAGIGSDHTKMQILQRVAERRSLSDPDVRTAYIAAAATIGSDHSRARSLDAALQQRDLAPRELASILDAVAGIGSDHEKMQLLVAMAERHTLDDELRSAYLRATASIGSDHSLGRAAHALLDAGEPNEQEVALALDVADHIGSDHERSRLLIRLADANLADAAIRAQFERGLAGIGSDHSLGMVLLSLMEDDVDEVTAGVVLRGVEGIGSDHTRGQVLVRLVRAGGVTEANRAAFDDAVDRIGSTHTRVQVLEALRR